MKAKTRPGSHSVMVQVVVHRAIGPRWLWPLNVAPTSGPVAPSTHSALRVSGLHSPMRVMSATIAHTCSGGAGTTALALWLLIPRTLAHGAGRAPHPPTPAFAVETGRHAAWRSGVSSDTRSE